MGILEGKVAVVFGGGGGSGREISRKLASEGAYVYIADMNGENALKIAEEISAKGQCAKGFACNVVNEEEVKAVIDTLMADHGRLDCAANVVGTTKDFCDISEISEENFIESMDINLKGNYHCLKYELPIMRQQHSGSVVNMGSAGGLIGQRRQGAYNMNKFGVLGLSKAAALDFAADNIRINTVCPGPMLSDGMQYMLSKDPHFGDQYLKDVPLGRFIEMENVANTFAFLLSDLSDGITGADIRIDGGMTAD